MYAIILVRNGSGKTIARKTGDDMDEVLTIHLPGEIRQMLNRTPEELARDVRLYAALMLFRLGKLSSGAAAAMAGLPRVMFLDICAENDIAVSQISGDDLRRELDGV
jgi:predicted HTH domain antitoxin